MFRNPFATSTLTLALALGWATPLLHVRAQEGVSYVMSNDGTVQYPCEGAALAEVYYQDKCEFWSRDTRFVVFVERADLIYVVCQFFRWFVSMRNIDAELDLYYGTLWTPTGAPQTTDGKKLHKVEVLTDYLSSRDDFKLHLKC